MHGQSCHPHVGAGPKKVRMVQWQSTGGWGKGLQNTRMQVSRLYTFENARASFLQTTVVTSSVERSVH